MSGAVSSLAELFPEGDYRFRLTLRRGEPAEFFRAQDPTGKVLAERGRWLAAEPNRYTALSPEGEPLLDEFVTLAEEWGATAGRICPATIRAVASSLEPDILLLSPDSTAGGQFTLRGGALCFPTGWALEEKLGRTMDVIHGVVPGLNAALSAPIHQFLAKLRPGVAFQRDNWGLASTDELNLHPARHIPAPAPPVALDRLWLRVEHQALVALPRGGGIAFGIRIALHRLDEVARDAVARQGLVRALETMPADLAAYKRIDTVREEIIRLF
jgi:dimethylamine monooxygenase subunit A